MNGLFSRIILSFLIIGFIGFNNYVYADPFFRNGQFTANGIEWCEENYSLYEILGEKFFEHHKHSLESRVCASLYADPLWDYDGMDRTEKLIEKSRYYSQLEISESIEESQTGIIDTTPASSKDETLLRGITEDGQIMVQIIASKPMEHSPMMLNISFLDTGDTLISNVNYTIEATQEDLQVLYDSNGYSERGLVTLSTLPLQTNEPVNIEIVINGIGLPENKDGWSISKGQVLIFNVVPEFSMMATTILIIALTSILVLSLKSKLRILPNF